MKRAHRNGRSPKMRAILNQLAIISYGMTRDEAFHQSVCLQCKENIDTVPHDPDEYALSALCDNCYPKQEEY